MVHYSLPLANRGNTVVYSVGLDEQGLPTTTFLETIPAAAATTDDAGTGAAVPTETGVGQATAVPPAVLPDPTSNPVVTRNDDVAPAQTTRTTRPGKSTLNSLLKSSPGFRSNLRRSA